MAVEEEESPSRVSLDEPCRAARSAALSACGSVFSSSGAQAAQQKRLLKANAFPLANSVP